MFKWVKRPHSRPLKILRLKITLKQNPDLNKEVMDVDNVP